jgi:hypothetical protein
MRHFLDQVTLADLLQSQVQIAERLHARQQTDIAELPTPLLTLGTATRG